MFCSQIVTFLELTSHCDPLFLFICPSLSSGGHPIVPDKVQELAESLQQISGQLNTVLSALSSLAQRQSAPPYSGFSLPLSQPHSTQASTPATSAQMHTLGPSCLAPPPSVRLSEPSWTWAPQGTSTAVPLFNTPISSSLKASGDFINSRWSQIFPGTPKNSSFSCRKGLTIIVFVKKCFLSVVVIVAGPVFLLQVPLWTQSPRAPWGLPQLTLHTLLQGNLHL